MPDDRNQIVAARRLLARELCEWSAAGGPVEAVVAAFERLAEAVIAEDRRKLTDRFRETFSDRAHR